MINGDNNKTQQLIDYFDQISTDYHNAFLNKQVAKSKIDFLIKQWDLKPGQDLLEVGCGPGHLTKFIVQALQHQGKITLLDISPSMIELAKKNTSHLAKKMELKYRIGDIHCHDLHQTFDRIIIFNAFPHFFNKISSLLNCVRHLKKNGLIVISHNNCRKKIINIHQRKGLPKYLSSFPTEIQFKKIALLSGLEILLYQDNQHRDFFIVKMKPFVF